MPSRPKPTINRSQIYGLLDKMLADAGPEALASMKLLQVEATLRQQNREVVLPGKTVLRECINKYRSDRWPQTAPKKTARFW
jgi:hypothetical protein